MTAAVGVAVACGVTAAAVGVAVAAAGRVTAAAGVAAPGVRGTAGAAEGHLALAEHLARDAVERVVVEAQEGAAHQVHAVEDEAAGNGRLAAAEPAAGRPKAHRPRVAAELERRPRAAGDAVEHLEVEVDDVPAGQHVGVELADAGGEGVEGLALAGAADGAVGQGAPGGVDDVHLVGARAVERDGEEAPAGGVGLDVEGQHRRRHLDVGRAQLGVVEHAGDAFAGRGGARDLAAAADPAVDQVAHGEADIGLEGPDAVLLEAVAEGRRVRGDGDLHPHDGPAVEGPPRGAALARRPQLPGAGGVRAADVEVGRLAAVAHEERASTLQDPIEVDDGRPVLDAVGGLQDEAARHFGGAAGRLVGDRHRLEGRPRQRREFVESGERQGRR